MSLMNSNEMLLLECDLSSIDAQRFRTITTHSPVGDGRAESKLPFWDGDVDRRTTIIKLLEVSGQIEPDVLFADDAERHWLVQQQLLTADEASLTPDYLEIIGQGLYQSLFPADNALRSTLASALRMAEQMGEPLHLRLKYGDDASKRSRLADYPWELLHDGERFLLHDAVGLSRYLAYEALAPALPAQERLNVLLLSSSATDPSPQLASLPDVEQQAVRQGLRKAFDAGLIRLTQLEKVTWQGLSRYSTDCEPNTSPQVVHFDGHGFYGKRCKNPECRQIHSGTKVQRCSRCQQTLPAPEGFVLFEQAGGAGADYISARDFALLLPKSVLLVVLSACRSGMAVAGESLFNGTAQQLIDKRIPAVVAMQYSVRADAASQFAEQFYRVLGKREPLIAALQEGRKWMLMTRENQWYRPVLYTRWRDNHGGQLFQPESKVDNVAHLSRFEALELERWRRELDDLEEDYESVKKQLRWEQDGPTRNRLDLQVEQIGQDMNECEQKISRLERGDG